VCQTYGHAAHLLAGEWVDEIVRDFTDSSLPLENYWLDCSITRWRENLDFWL